MLPCLLLSDLLDLKDMLALKDRLALDMKLVMSGCYSSRAIARWPQLFRQVLKSCLVEKMPKESIEYV